MEGRHNMEKRNGECRFGPPGGGDDHPRRGAIIVGDAVTGLLDRVVYLEAVIAHREMQIVDLTEERDELKDTVHSNRLFVEKDRLRMEVLNRRAERLLGAMKERFISTTSVLNAIRSRSNMRPIGSGAKSIKSIPPLLMGIAFELGQLSRYWKGERLQFDDFDE